MVFLFSAETGRIAPRAVAKSLDKMKRTLVAALKLPRASMPHATTISRILGYAKECEPTRRVEMAQPIYDVRLSNRAGRVVEWIYSGYTRLITWLVCADLTMAATTCVCFSPSR
jgi:hypothetical protein